MFSLTYQLGKVCRDDSATGVSGDTLLSPPTHRNYFPVCSPATKIIERKDKGKIAEKESKHVHILEI